MDKRSLIFFICVMVSLVIVNFFFESKKTKDAAQWLQQKDKEKELLTAATETKIGAYGNWDSLPFYVDKLTSTPFGYGVRIGSFIVTTPYATQLLPYIWTKEEKGSVSWQLIPSEAVPIAIYSANPTEKLPVAPLTKNSTATELLLIGIDPTTGILNKYIGEYHSGNLQILLDPPHTSCLVLQKTTQGIGLVGVYNPKTQEIVDLQEEPNLSKILAFPPKYSTEQVAVGQQEQFYVLNTEYQQIVFSNIGGSIYEINLPFKTEQHPKSLVWPTENDSLMKEKEANNDLFPQYAYFVPEKNPSGEYVEKKEQSLGGYYPLLRRNLMRQGSTPVMVAPEHYCTNISSKYPETAKAVYRVLEFTPQKIVFESKDPLRTIRKTYQIPAQNPPYCIELTVEIEGDAAGLFISTGAPEVEFLAGSYQPSLKYKIMRSDNAEIEKIDLPKKSNTVSSVYPSWVSNSNGFFGLILDPLDPIGPGYQATCISGDVWPSRLIALGAKYKPSEFPAYLLKLPFPRQTNKGTYAFRLFAGPYEESVLNAVDQIYKNPQTGQTPYYIGCQSFHGWFSFISEPFAKFLWILMKFFHSITHSWGFSIILLTIVLRILLYPLNAWSFKSQKRMQVIAPQMQAIQKKHKKDPKKAQIEIMNLYRQYKTNPFSGCLPLLIQMPFLLGMFNLLQSSFALRGASFIPGWINNLAAPDVLFQWKTHIFYIGNQLHLLPLLVGLAMWIQQRMSSNLPKDPSQMTEQQKQQKMMGNVMIIFFSVIFYKFPSGLNLYWLSSTLLGLLQQWYTNKYVKVNMPQAPQQK